MTLQTYLIIAWLFACYIAAANDRKTAEREFGIVVCFLSALLMSLAWPALVLVHLGTALRRAFVRGA